jgi:long-chain acyl-CoA synthetase
MNSPSRLFDCIAIQAKEPKPDLLAGKVNGEWKLYSTEEVHRQVYQLANALLAMGISNGDGTVEGRDKVGLISASRPEWLIVDLAVQLTGAILVPLYSNTGPKELEEIILEAGLKCIFVSTAELCNLVNEILPRTPSVQKVYAFDYVNTCTHWQELLKPITAEDKSRIDTISDRIKTHDVATIIYTSGTTGHPKGVMLTHHNILSNARTSGDILMQVPMVNKRALSFLPLNHIFEKMVAYIYLFYGFSIYYAESMDTIGSNLREAKPYIFTAVPRLLEKVFERIMTEGQKLTGIKRKIFLWAISLGEQYELEGKSPWYNLKLAIANKLVFSKWREALGGNVQCILIGSSACPLRLEKIFTAGKIDVLEGYGLTETSPVIAVNRYKKSERKFGTVGPLLDGVQVKIDQDGEILCKGPNIMVGYYKKPELTAEVLVDGWFHTGDIGELDKDGFLKITDRKKEIFKTSGGKYIAPTPIENRMKESMFIEQMMVVGAGRKFASALIVPSFTNLKLWCKENKIEYLSNEEIVSNEQVIRLFQSAINSYNPEFNHVEQIKKFVLLPEEWSIDNGELTPTGKMKRRVILEKYKTEIDTMYESELGDLAPAY